MTRMGAETRADVDAAEKLLRLASESDGSASEALPSRGRVGVSALLRNFARTGGVPLFMGASRCRPRTSYARTARTEAALLSRLFRSAAPL